MKQLSLFACVAIIGGFAWTAQAGYHAPQEVYIYDYEFPNPPPSSPPLYIYASGSLQGARSSADNVQRLACTSDLDMGYCYAQDAAGRIAYCYTYDAELRQAIGRLASTTASVTFQFSGQESNNYFYGECENVGVMHSSWVLP